MAEENIQGITLIELLVTLSIVLILAVISVPTFNSIIKNYRISAVSENLYAVLQFARSEAVKKNTNVYVSFSDGDSWCYGVNLNSACNCSIPNNCSLGSHRAENPQQISLAVSGLSGNSVYFEGSHGAANASGSVSFTLFGEASLIRIDIGRMGGLQMCATGISGYSAC